MNTAATRFAKDPVLALAPGQCKFPIGSPGAPGFHFCCRPVVDGEVYCYDHCCLSYPNWAGPK